MECPLGEIQPNEGKSNCMPCTISDDGKKLTSNTKHTECIIDIFALKHSLIDVMFEDGMALSVSFLVAITFCILAAYMQFRIRQYGNDKVGQLSKLAIFLKAYFPGFSFSSEIFLFMKIAYDNPTLAWTMLTFRFTHVILGVLLVYGLYSDGAIAILIDSIFRIFIDLSDLRDELDFEFAEANLPIVFAINALFMTNINLIQFMPWKKKPFFSSSNGFPTLKLMKFCNGMNIVQSTGSVFCQVVYLTRKPSDTNGIPKSQNDQTVALFVLSISCTVGGLIFTIFFFALKGQLLSKVQKHSTQVKRHSALLDAEINVSEIYKSELLQLDAKNNTHHDDAEGSNGSSSSRDISSSMRSIGSNDIDLSTFSYINPIHDHDHATKDFINKNAKLQKNGHRSISILRGGHKSFNPSSLKKSTTDNSKSHNIEKQNEFIEQLLMHRESLQQDLHTAMTDVRRASMNLLPVVEVPPSISDNLFENV